MLKAGVSIIDISPKPGVGLAGYPHLVRENTGIHNPIYATALLLDDGKKKIVMVHTELLYFGKEYLNVLRREFPEVELTISSTHTHCAPWASELLASEKADGITINEEYVRFLMEQVRKVIREAIENPFDAEIGFGTVRCGGEMGVGGNRHSADGIHDDHVGTIAVRDLSGEVRYILVNYALHPTLLHEDDLEVTGDYPSYIRRFFGFAFPKAAFAFAQGCSGDQSTRYFRVAQNFEEAARVGTTIGVEAYHAIQNMEWKRDLTLSFSMKALDLPFKKFPPLEVALRNLEIAEANFNAVKDRDFLTRWNAELRLFGAQSTKQFSILAEQNYVSPELPFEICHIRIGDYHILTSQGELFVEVGLKVKSHFPEGRAYFFETTNGAAPGYLYTKEGAEEGGYEYGNSMFAENAYLIVMDEFDKMIKEDQKNV